MFELCEQKNSLPLETKRIVRLMMAFSDTLVSPPHRAVQQCRAYACTYKEDEEISVYVYLYLTIDKVGILYKYSDKVSTPEERQSAEDEATQFAEDMGFLMDDMRFNELDISKQEKLLATIPLFTPATSDIGWGRAVAKKVDVIPEEAAKTTEAVLGDVPVKETLVEIKSKEEHPAEETGHDQEVKEKPGKLEFLLTKFRLRAAATEKVKNNRS